MNNCIQYEIFLISVLKTLKKPLEQHMERLMMRRSLHINSDTFRADLRMVSFSEIYYFSYHIFSYKNV